MDAHDRKRTREESDLEGRPMMTFPGEVTPPVMVDETVQVVLQEEVEEETAAEEQIPKELRASPEVPVSFPLPAASSSEKQREQA